MNNSTIADFCTAKNITQREIAVKMGYTLRQVQNLINDERNDRPLGPRQKAVFQRAKRLIK